MTRYLVSLALFVAGITFGALINGATLSAFVDVPSLAITVVFPFLAVSTVFGFKNMGKAFSTPLQKEPEQDSLKQALSFFRMYGDATWIAGLAGFIIGLISMLANLDDRNMIGPAMALAMVSLLYSGIIHLVIIIPFTVLIKKHFSGGAQTETNTMKSMSFIAVLPFIVLLPIILIFMF
jgi:flagellar motor component MotA